MKTFQFKDLMVNVAGAGEKAFFCGFGYTCNYGTYCGWFTPCGYTCDYGRTHPTLPFAVEQAAVAAPAAQVGAGAGAGPGGGAALCAFHTICPTFTCYHYTPCYANTCGFRTCFGCTVAITNICQNGPTILPCRVGTCGFTIDPTPTIQVDPEGVRAQLAAVKAQLQHELAAVEQGEKTVAEALRPQTAADVEELQGKLRDAIAELDKQKQELQKKSEKTKK